MPNNRFSSIKISNEAFEQLRNLFQPKKTDEELTSLLKDKFQGPRNGLNLEKIEGKIFSGRADLENRMFLVFIDSSPFIFAANPHNYDAVKRTRIYQKYRNEVPDISDVEHREISLSEEQNIILEKDNNEQGIIFSKSKVVFLDQDQNQAANALYQAHQEGKSVFVNSIAGSGKTLLALDHLAKLASEVEIEGEEEGREEETRQFIYLTKSETLAKTQQDIFARLYPDQLDKVRFVSHSQFLKEKLEDDDLKIATYDDFVQWYEENKSKKIKADKIHKDFPKNPQELYDEFCHLAGNYDSEEDYKSATMGKNYFPPKPSIEDETEESKKAVNRDDIVTIYNQYKQYLLEKSLTSISDIKLPNEIDENQKHPLIIVDEAQQFTKRECQTLKETSKSKILHLFGDSNQASPIFNPNNLALDRETDFGIKLSINYRSSKAVSKLAKIILDKINAIGNYGDASYQLKEDDNQEDGNVKFELEGNLTTNLKQAAADPRNYMVIVPNDQIRQEVKEIFKGTVLTPKECHGLEYKNVILYKCFPKQKQRQTKSKVAAGHKAKDKGNVNNLKQIGYLRTIFSSITRAQESIFIVNENSDLVQDLQNKIQEQQQREEQQREEQQKPSSNNATKPRSKIKPQSTVKLSNIYLSAKYLANAAHLKSQGIENADQITEIIENLSNIKTEEDKEEIRQLITNLIKQNYELLQNNEDLCRKILKGDNFSEIKQNITSYYYFLPKRKEDNIAGTELRWGNIPNNINLDLKIGQTDILSLAIKQNNEIFNRFIKSLKSININNNIRNEYSHLLFDEDINKDNFKDLFEFLEINKEKDLNEIINFYQEKDKDKVDIVLDYLISKTLFDDSIKERINILNTKQANKLYIRLAGQFANNYELLKELIERGDIEEESIKSTRCQNDPKQKSVKGRKGRKGQKESRVEMIFNQATEFVSLLLTKEEYQKKEIIEPILTSISKDKDKLRIIINAIEDLEQKERRTDFSSVQEITKVIGKFPNNYNYLHTTMLDLVNRSYRFSSNEFSTAIDENNATFIKFFDSSIKKSDIESLSDKRFVKLVEIQDLGENIKKNIINIISSILDSSSANYIEKLPTLLQSNHLNNEIKDKIVTIIKQQANDGYNLLHILAEDNGEKCIELLKNKIPDEGIKNAIIKAIEQKQEQGYTPIHILSGRNGEEFKKLLQSKDLDDGIKNVIIAAVKQRCDDESNPLHSFAEKKGEEFKNLLQNTDLDDGIKSAIIEAIKQQNKCGDNPLFNLVRKKEEEFTKLLQSKDLDDGIKGAIIQAILQLNKEEFNSLYILAHINEEEFTKLLQSKDLDDGIKDAIIQAILQPNKEKFNSLHALAQKNGEKFIELLQSKDLDDGIKGAIIEAIKQKQEDGYTPIHNLVEKNVQKFTKLLQNKDLDENIKRAIIGTIQQQTNRGNSVLHTLVERNGEEFTKLLQSKDLDEDAKNAIIGAICKQTEEKLNSLHILAQNDGKEFAKLLQSKDLDDGIKDAIIKALLQQQQDEYNPLYALAHHNKDEFTKLLQSKDLDEDIKSAIIEAIPQADQFGLNTLNILILPSENKGKFAELLQSENLDKGIKDAIIESIKQHKNNGFNILYFLAQNDGKEFVKLLQSKIPDEEIKKAVIDAVQEEQLGREKQLGKEEQLGKEKLLSGCNSLHMLAEKSGEEFKKLLQSKNLGDEIKSAIIKCIKKTSSGMYNPLHILAEKSGKEFKQLLQSKNLDRKIKSAIIETIQQESEEENNPLHILAIHNGEEFKELLQDEILDGNIKDAIITATQQKNRKRNNPLHILAEKNEDEFAKLLQNENLDSRIMRMVKDIDKQQKGFESQGDVPSSSISNAVVKQAQTNQSHMGKI